MEAGLHVSDELATGTELEQKYILGLALSVDSAAFWRFDFATDALTSTDSLDEVLGLPGAPGPEVLSYLTTLVAPLVAAARAMADGQDLDLEQQFQPNGSGTKWIRFRARAIDGPAGRSLLGVATDMTQQHEDQQALTDIVDRYRLLVELSPEAIAVHAAGVVTYVNPATVSFLCANSSAQIVGHMITDFVHPDSIPAMRERIMSLNTHGAVSEPAEALLLRFDGGTKLVESVSVQTTWDGRPACQVIMRDITVQRAAEAALRHEAALVVHVSDAIIGTDQHGVVASWNPAAESIYGRRPADAVGRTVGEVVGAHLDPTAICRAGGVVEATHRRFDGSMLAIRVSAAEMGSGYVLVCTDTTARRRAEEHFSTVVAALEEGIVVVGPTGMIESANPAAQRILGATEFEMVGAPATEGLLHDENDKPISAADSPLELTRKTGAPQDHRVVRLRYPDGRSTWLSLSCRSLSVESDPPHTIVVSFSDITEHRELGERLAHEATHDPLTGLANRTLVLQRLTAVLGARRRGGTTAVLFIDLDKFKVINDSLGHSVGDQVLRIVGSRLRHRVRDNDLVGRLGGDEFAVIVFDVAGPSETQTFTEHLRRAIAAPITVNGRQLHVNASIGIVTTEPGDRRTAEDLLRDADVAMYQAKAQGRGRYEFFDVGLRERLQRHQCLEQDLRYAVDNGQLLIAYQPVVDIDSDRMVAVEALLRWTHPNYGTIAPTEFIPLAEESDLINLIGDRTLPTMILDTAAWRTRESFDIDLAVNVSGRQLDDPGLATAVDEALRAARLPAGALCLEITESMLMRDPPVAHRRLSALRELGVRVAIDDFGTGYSSLAQIRRLPVDTLKIDQSFIFELDDSKDARVIVTSIIAMAHAVDLTVIAEGVENKRVFDILRDLDCDQVQGYYIGRPVAIEDLRMPQR